jgi:hypothetical protein
MKTWCGCSRQVCNLAEVRAVQAIPLTVHQPLSNAAELIGKVAVVQRGDVSFVEKARVVQASLSPQKKSAMQSAPDGPSCRISRSVAG